MHISLTQDIDQKVGNDKPWSKERAVGTYSCQRQWRMKQKYERQQRWEASISSQSHVSWNNQSLHDISISFENILVVLHLHQFKKKMVWLWDQSCFQKNSWRQCPQNQQQLQFDVGSQSLEPNSEQSIARNVLRRHCNCYDGIVNHTIETMELEITQFLRWNRRRWNCQWHTWWWWSSLRWPSDFQSAWPDTRLQQPW